jgi:hypothetical protein
MPEAPKEPEEKRPTDEVTLELQELIALKMKEKYSDGISKIAEQKLKESIQLLF